jgi:hypothetical protein
MTRDLGYFRNTHNNAYNYFFKMDIIYSHGKQFYFEVNESYKVTPVRFGLKSNWRDQRYFTKLFINTDGNDKQFKHIT